MIWRREREVEWSEKKDAGAQRDQRLVSALVKKRKANLLQCTTGTSDGDDTGLDGTSDTGGDDELLFLIDLLHGCPVQFVGIVSS